MKLNALLSALLMGLVAPAAMAATYTYAGPDVVVADGNGTRYSFVGAYNVADGPPAGRNPAVFSALEAAVTVFGGQQSDYAVSIYSPFYDPTQTYFDSVLGFNVATNPPLFNVATGQVAPGQTVSSNAIISHTGWYDTWYGIPEPDPAIVLHNVDPALLPSVSAYAQPYVMSNAPFPGVLYTVPGGIGPGPAGPGITNYLLAFQHPETFSKDYPPAGYAVPNPSVAAGANPSWSAYVRDHMWGPPEREFYTNYVWKVAPIPEPETYAMMLAGLGLITLMARRRMNG